MYYIGIDVGGMSMKVGLVSEDGRILDTDRYQVVKEDTWQDQIKGTALIAKTLIEKHGLTLEDVKAVGVGVPGLANQKTGEIVFCTNLGWHDVPYREEFQKYLNLPVFLDNDATVAGLAESVVGVCAGTQSSVFITLGTGVGSGIVINGKVWSGFHGTGSEIGHMTLVAGGEPCTCGNRGCLERYCSATAMIRMGNKAAAKYPDSKLNELTGGNPRKMTARFVVDAAREGDPAATEAYAEYISYLGQALASIANLLDPEVIALGGGVCGAGEFLLEPVKAEMEKHLLFKGQPYSRLELAKLGNDAGIIGAAMLGR